MQNEIEAPIQARLSRNYEREVLAIEWQRRVQLSLFEGPASFAALNNATLAMAAFPCAAPQPRPARRQSAAAPKGAA